MSLEEYNKELWIKSYSSLQQSRWITIENSGEKIIVMINILVIKRKTQFGIGGSENSRILFRSLYMNFVLVASHYQTWCVVSLLVIVGQIYN